METVQNDDTGGTIVLMFAGLLIIISLVWIIARGILALKNRRKGQ